MHVNPLSFLHAFVFVYVPIHTMYASDLRKFHVGSHVSDKIPCDTFDCCYIEFKRRRNQFECIIGHLNRMPSKKKT